MKKKARLEIILLDSAQELGLVPECREGTKREQEIIDKYCIDKESRACVFPRSEIVAAAKKKWLGE